MPGMASLDDFKLPVNHEREMYTNTPPLKSLEGVAKNTCSKINEIEAFLCADPQGVFVYNELEALKHCIKHDNRPPDADNPRHSPIDTRRPPLPHHHFRHRPPDTDGPRSTLKQATLADVTTRREGGLGCKKSVEMHPSHSCPAWELGSGSVILVHLDPHTAGMQDRLNYFSAFSRIANFLCARFVMPRPCMALKAVHNNGRELDCSVGWSRYFNVSVAWPSMLKSWPGAHLHGRRRLRMTKILPYANKTHRRVVVSGPRRWMLEETNGSALTEFLCQIVNMAKTRTSFIWKVFSEAHTGIYDPTWISNRLVGSRYTHRASSLPSP